MKVQECLSFIDLSFSRTNMNILVQCVSISYALKSLLLLSVRTKARLWPQIKGLRLLNLTSTPNFKYWDNKYVVLSKRLPRLESGAFLKSSIVDALDTVLYRLVLGSLLGILFFIYSEQMNWHLVFKYWCCMFLESRIINYGDDTEKIQITKWSIFHKLSDAGSVKLCDMLVYYFLISQ